MSLSIEQFTSRFHEFTEKWSWEVQGFIDRKNFVHPIDFDTKVISTVFERLASPVVRQIAKQHDYLVEVANQTTYPDFTLTHHGGHRIALDIKTTYVRPRMVLTLGGYASFLRNGTKNILYPYNSYSEHWVLGFVYRQIGRFEEYDLDNLPVVGDIKCPYQVKQIFIRNKHEICGLRAGSGNTKNIGSFVADSPEQFASLNGPFTVFRDAKAACDYYWKNYDRYIHEIGTTADLKTHRDFSRFL